MGLTKQTVMLALLEDGDVFVSLDPRSEGVIVPPQYKEGTGPLVLRLGLNMPVPIPDLDVGKDKLSATLSFDRIPFRVVVPWHAVFLMRGDNMAAAWGKKPDKDETEESKDEQLFRGGLKLV